MALKESNAFVLFTRPLGEADKITVLFTCNYGKVHAVARGARRPKNRFGAGLEPLSEVQVTYDERETRELASLKGCELLCSPFEQGSTPEGEAFLHHIAELVDRFNPLAEPNPRVYRLLKATVEAFRATQELQRLAAYFEIWILKLAGFFGDLERGSGCGHTLGEADAVRMSSGGSPLCLQCSRHAGGFLVQPTLRDAMKEILRRTPREWISKDLSHSTLTTLRQVTARLIRNILEGNLKVELL